MTDLVLTREIVLRCSVAHAFRVFTEHIELWWPRPHRRTQAATMVLEPQARGRLLERAPDGEEWVLGRITVFEPPERLCFQWFPGSPSAPTEVDIAFGATPDGSRIAIVHRALSPEAAAAWPDKVALFERGWDTILPALAAFIHTDRT